MVELVGLKSTASSFHRRENQQVCTHSEQGEETSRPERPGAEHYYCAAEAAELGTSGMTLEPDLGQVSEPQFLHLQSGDHT